MRRAVALALALLAAWTAPISGAFPRPNGYVNDFAAILDDATEARLTAQLAALEKETSAEVAVVTVKSLDGMSVEEYANKLFADWGIGKKQKDNGVLLLVAPAEHDVRIEVGYGLEGVLPDGLAGDIIRTDIIPQFKANNFPAGVTAGVNRIAAIVRREPGSAERHATSADNGPPLWFVIAFLGLFVFVGWFALGVGIRTKTFGTLIFGGMFGIMPAIFLLAIRSAFAAAVLGALALAAFVFGLAKGRSQYWLKLLRAPVGRAGASNGWQMGPSTSGGSSGGSSSSSGGSFGGGSSGGGGASGHW